MALRISQYTHPSSVILFCWLLWSITSWGIMLMINLMYWYSWSSVFKYMLLMLIVINFSSNVLTRLLNTIFVVSSPAVSVLAIPRNSNQSPPAVIWVRFASSFSSLLSTSTLAYVAVLIVGTCCLSIQNRVSVPLIHSLPSVSFLLPVNNR